MYHLPVEIFDHIFTYYEDSGDVSSHDWSVLTQVSKSFHARFVPSLFGIINEEQLRHPSLALTLEQKPQYAAFVRKANWQLMPFAEDEDTASPSTHQEELERLIAVLSKFSALTVLKLIVGDRSVIPAGIWALERVPSLSQLADLLPHRLEHLAFSSPAVVYHLNRDMWTMLQWLVSSGAVHTLRFSTEMSFSECPRDLEWPTIRSLRIERPDGNDDSDEEIGFLTSACSSLQQFEFAFEDRPDELGWFFATCLPDRPFRKQLRKLTLASICLFDFEINAPSLPLAIPALEEFKLMCAPPKGASIDQAAAFTNNLQALFPPFDIAHHLRSLQLHYRVDIDEFFNSDFSSRNFDRFQDRSRYPSLVDFGFVCQHVHALGDSELPSPDDLGEVLGYRVLDEAVVRGWRRAFEELAAKASPGMRLIFGLDEFIPRRAVWSLRCHVGKGQTEEKYWLEGNAACNNVVTMGDNNGQSES